MPSLRPAILATLLMLPGLAIAEDQVPSGFYLGASQGLEMTQSAGQSVAGFGGVNLHTDTGPQTSLSLGYRNQNGVRLELEGLYSTAHIDRVSGAFQGEAVSGSQRNYGLMLNATTNLEANLPWGWTPYAGLGVGWVRSTWDDVRVSGEAASMMGRGVQDRFAYQAIAGLEVPLPSVSGLSVTGEYRFRGTAGEDAFKGSINGQDARFGSDSSYSHSLLVGLRYSFGAPTAPVPVIAAPPAVNVGWPSKKAYLLFFDFNSSDLTERANSIIAAAVSTARRPGAEGTARIEVMGHSDRAGNLPYNQRLSQKRAEVVAEALVAHGVVREQIAITAFGETKPLEPTADGVRNALNRRVEIILR